MKGGRRVCQVEGQRNKGGAFCAQRTARAGTFCAQGAAQAGALCAQRAARAGAFWLLGPRGGSAGRRWRVARIKLGAR